MNKYVKKGLKITGIVVGIIAVIYLCLCFVFYFATKPASDKAKQTNEIALEKTPITTITKNYHLSRSVESNSLAGTSKKERSITSSICQKAKKLTFIKQIKEKRRTNPKDF